MLSSNVQGTASPLIPLVENYTAGGDPQTDETPSSGMANTLSALTAPPQFSFGVWLHGVGGAAYSALMKGTAPYTQGLTQWAAAYGASKNLAKPFVALGETWTHGEDDYAGNNTTPCLEPCNAPQYAAYLTQYQANLLADVQTIVPGTTSFPLYISQMNAGIYGDLAHVQLAACLANSNIICVTPKYFMTYNATLVHMNNTSYKLLGEYYGKVINKVQFGGVAWKPLYMTGATLAGTTATVAMSIPTGTLAIDTTTLPATTNYGFEFYQSGGNPVSINSVALSSDSKSVSIGLSAAPTGGNQQIRYAWTCHDAITPGAGQRCGGHKWGNIHDTDSAASPASNSTGRPLYDWLWEAAVPLPSAPQAPALGVVTSTTPATASVPFNPWMISGYPITSCTATSSPGGITGSSTTSPITVSGLTNGTTYTFSVSCSNAYGASAGSAASNSVTPTGVPAAAADWALAGDYSDNSGGGHPLSMAGSGNSFVADAVHGTVLQVNGSGYATSATFTLPASYTMAGWFYLPAASSGQNAQLLGSTNPHVILAINTSTSGGSPVTWSERIGYGASMAYFAWNPSVFPTGTWVHLAATYNNTTGAFAIYRNGVQAGSGANQGTTSVAGFNVGSFSGGTMLTSGSKIAKVKVWNSALSAAQIAEVAAAN